MWLSILLLAMVPLFFFFSDNVTTMFPQLASYFPAKHKKVGVGAASDSAAGVAGPAVADANVWMESTTAQGYVAFVLSPDGQYRLSVGCAPQGTPAAQLTNMKGQAPAPALTVSYRYGKFKLLNGYLQNSEVINAVAQFADIQIVGADGLTPVTSFTLDAKRSESIARALQNNCSN